MTRTEVYQAVHIAGVSVVAAMGYILTNAPNLPQNWRVGIGAVIAALSAGGLYWAKPPGVTVVPTPDEKV